MGYKAVPTDSETRRYFRRFDIPGPRQSLRNLFRQIVLTLCLIIGVGEIDPAYAIMHAPSTTGVSVDELEANAKSYPHDVSAPTAVEQRRMEQLAAALRSYSDAREYGKAYETALELLILEEATWGPEHPYTAGTLDWLHGLSVALQQNAKALEYLERAHAAYLDRLGETHVLASNSLGRLAAGYFEAGDAARAFKTANRAADMAAKAGHVRPEHNALGVAAFAADVLGDTDANIQAMQRLLNVAEGAYGSDNDYVESWRNRLDLTLIGRVAVDVLAIPPDIRPLSEEERIQIEEHYSQVDSAVASGAFESVLDHVHSVADLVLGAWGNKHPLAADIYEYVSEYQRLSYNYENAIHLQKKAIEIYQSRLDALHPRVINSLLALANLQYASGNQEAVVDTLGLIRSLPGPVVRRNMREVQLLDYAVGGRTKCAELRVNGDAASVQSRNMYDAFFYFHVSKTAAFNGQWYESSYGTDIVLNYLINDYYVTERHGAVNALFHRINYLHFESSWEAIKENFKLLRLYGCLFGQAHPIALRVMESIAQDYDFINLPIQAEEVLREATAYGIQARGPMTFETVRLQQALGRKINLNGQTLQDRTRLKEGVDLLELALNRFDVAVRDELSRIRLVSDLALAYRDSGDPGRAYELLRPVMAEYANRLPSSPLLSGLYSVWGGALGALGRIEESAQAYEQALSHVLASAGRAAGALDVELSHYTMLKDAGRYEDAQRIVSRMMRMVEASPVLGGRSSNWLRSLMAEVELRQGDYESSLELARQSYDFFRQALTEQRWDFHRSVWSNQERLDSRILSHAAYRVALSTNDETVKEALFSEAFVAAQPTIAESVAEAVGRGAMRHFVKVGDLAKLLNDLEAVFELRQTLSTEALALGSNLGDHQADGPAEYDEMSLGERILGVDRRLTALEDRLRLDYPQVFGALSPAPVSVDELQGVGESGEPDPASALLSKSEALVLMTPPRDAHSGKVWVVTQEGVAWAEIPYTETELRDRIARLHGNLDVLSGRAPYGQIARTPGVRGFDRGLSSEIYRALLGAPAIAKLISEKTDLLLVPQGVLTSLPFAALVAAQPMGDNHDPEALRTTVWLGLERTLSIVPSVTSLRIARSLDRQDGLADAPRFFGIGDPVFGGVQMPETSRPDPGADANLIVKEPAGNFRYAAGDVARVANLPRLKGTRTEINEIARLLETGPDGVLLGGEASEAGLARALAAEDGRFSRARVVVLATHGLLAGSFEGTLTEPALALTPPAKPGQILRASPIADIGGYEPSSRAAFAGAWVDDGLLTASEIATFAINAEWVVLSACDTAAGDNPDATGLTGLARAFFYAGAHSLLVSQWRVDDTAAARLTTEAVRRAADDPGLTRAEALRESMRAILQDASRDANAISFAHPAYWAPFQFVGVPIRDGSLDRKNHDRKELQ